MGMQTLPTENPDALMHFVQGRNALHAYFGTGRVEDLEEARGNFAEAEHFDPTFALASFYIALADNELRDADSAISRLEGLTRRRVDFLPQAYLQLAYAHTKKYEDEHYFEAARALDEARKQAEHGKNRGLVLLIEAYRVFLFSVMGGRLHQGDRISYLNRAIELGVRLLRDREIASLPERNQIFFELHNALGIAYMRKGAQEQPFGQEQFDLWNQSRDHYRSALELNPAPARTLQNQGTLLTIEGDQHHCAEKPDEARRCYIEALALYQGSFKLNSRDQFVHYRIASLYARLGNWEDADRFFHSGLKENGSVKRVDWDLLFDAIQKKDSSLLIRRQP